MNFLKCVSKRKYLAAQSGGRYTKHIYVGSQRIVSKLGDFDSYGADPRRIEKAGDSFNGVKVDYASKYKSALNVVKANYESLKVPYYGLDNDDYVNGLGFCCNPTPTTATTATTNPTGKSTDNKTDNAELQQYYYHPDHLGSSSYITNLDGEVVQHVEYVPFGEVFLEEKNAVWNTPYLFNGKELDKETGMSYYGARYYEAKTSIWLSVDPLAEQTMSSYGYCYQNPVNLVDPTGMSAENAKPLDDYYINKDGSIEVIKTNDEFDRFYIETNNSQTSDDGKIKVGGYKLASQNNKNDSGYIALPSAFNGDGYGFKYTGSKNENYISGSAFAGLLGALNNAQLSDVSLNHWSNADGSSPKPSRSHKDGEVGDVRPLRIDQSGKPVLTTDNQFDIARNETLVNSLKNFGWTSILSEKNQKTGYITPGTTNYSGYTDKKTGKWIPVRHNNHFHIQKYKPNLIKLN